MVGYMNITISKKKCLAESCFIDMVNDECIFKTKLRFSSVLSSYPNQVWDHLYQEFVYSVLPEGLTFETDIPFVL